METLAIIAYEQPITKLKISEIRGVESESSIKTLEARGLIESGGQLDVPGNPILYKTTSLFLENTLKIIDFLSYFLVGRNGRAAARFLSNFWGPFFLSNFSRLTLTNRIF